MASRKKSAPTGDMGEISDDLLPDLEDSQSGLPERKRKLLAVEVRNFKGVEFCRIDFTKAITLVGGKNRAGKSSVLDGISGLLGGTAKLPTDPIRDGADSARLWADLGDMTVERIISADVPTGTKLTMFDENMAKVPAPQTELARMYNALSFDPMGFGDLTEEKQKAVLKRVAGLDLDELVGRRTMLADERKAVNADVATLEAKFKGRTFHQDAPEKDVDVAELTAKLQEHDAWEKERAEKERSARAVEQQLSESNDTIARRRRELDAAQQALTQAEEFDASLRAKPGLEAAIRAFLDFRAAPEPARADLLDSIRKSGEQNEKLRQNRERAQLGKDLQAKKAKQEELTRGIAACNEEQTKAIASASFPIEGLGFDEEFGKPTYLGHPIKQASDSERWRIGACIALALNPSLPLLLIRRGGDFDPDTLAEMSDWAQEKGAQLVIEVVRPDGEGCDVVMRNGLGEQRGAT